MKDPQTNPQVSPASIFQTLARWAFLVLVVLIPFRARFTVQKIDLTPIFGDYTDLLLFASDVALGFVLLAWTAVLVLDRRKPHPGPWYLSWPLLGILGAGILSAFFSVFPAISWMHILRLVLLFGLYLYVVNEVHDLNHLVTPVAIMVLIQACVAVTQFLWQGSLGLHFLDELILDPNWPGVSIVWAPGQIALRSYGLTDHPNILGGSLAMGLIFLQAAYLAKLRTSRVLLAAVQFLGLVALVLTFSRSAWLAYIAGSVVIFVWLSKQKERDQFRDWLQLSLSALLIVTPFVLSNLHFLSSRFGMNPTADALDPGLLSPEGMSLNERALLADAANAMFFQHPITGVGLGVFPIALQEFDPDFPYNFQPVHNVLMDAAVETGLFGGLSYVLAVLLPIIAFRLNKRNQDIPILDISPYALLTVVVMIGIFDYYPWFLVTGRLWHWLIWGLVGTTSKSYA